MLTAAILGYVARRGLTCLEARLGVVLAVRRGVARNAVATVLARRIIARRGLADVDLAEVAAQLAQLVAQLRCVLEAQLVGGRDHLLLQLDHHALELVLWHLPRRRRLAPRAFAARHLGL